MTTDNAPYFALVEEQLTAGRRVRMTLVGASMTTALRPGEPIEVAPLQSDPAVGEVVLFRCGGRHLLHRIVAVSDGVYTLQGDNCRSCEHCRRADIVARLVAVPRLGPTDGERWRHATRRSLQRKWMKNKAIDCFGREGRRRLRPWYFALLALFMWAPLNGLGLPIDSYIFGLRIDHLFHASVFFPCALLLTDVVKPRWLLWVVCLGIGLLTEGVQWLLPWRGFDINDLVANTGGVTLGWLVLLAVRRAIRRRRRYPVRAKHAACSGHHGHSDNP